MELLEEIITVVPKQTKNGAANSRGQKVLVLFGTRPEVIKFSPVIHQLKKRKFELVIVSSSQHKDLLDPFLDLLKIKADYDLQIMTDNQTPNEVCARVMLSLDKILHIEKPNLILVQGDTTTALAGAIAGFNRKIPVGHVEAGLRSGNLHSPFPEEFNRRLISQMATYHFAATELNRHSLLAEGVSMENIHVTGNTVVDALNFVLKNFTPSDEIETLIARTTKFKRILLTTHRRESFGAKMRNNLKVLADFVEKHKDVCLFFPVHLNPNVRRATRDILARRERIFLLDPLDYIDFVTVMKESWLIVSDSGGVQEEAPSLGKPLLILRENTERPEAVRAKIAKLVGGNPEIFRKMLDENYSLQSWINNVKQVENPFGDGKAAKRIVRVLEKEFPAKAVKRAINSKAEV